MRQNADKCRKMYRAFKMLADDRQFNADKWSAIMTLMSLRDTKLLFVQDKIWGILMKTDKKMRDKSLCIINKR